MKQSYYIVHYISIGNEFAGGPLILTEGLLCFCKFVSLWTVFSSIFIYEITALITIKEKKTEKAICNNVTKYKMERVGNYIKSGEVLLCCIIT